VKGAGAAKRRATPLGRREALEAYLYLSPWLVGLVVFLIGPIIASIYLSLTQYDILAPPRWVGLANYRHALFEDDLFWRAVYNTVYYAALFVPLNIAGSLATALLLNQPVRGQAVFRTLFFVPSITPAVAATLLWMWILNPQFGPLNALLDAVGIPGPPWLSSSTWAKPSIVLMSLWAAVGGGTMIIFLAGLQSIPLELYEAAEIDGSGEWHKFRHVTLPMLSPSIFFNLVIGLIAACHVFTPAYVATEGGPNYATMFYVLYLFNNAFRFLYMGYAATLAWLFVAMVLVLVVLQFRFAARWVYYEGAVER
jgi:multiple sugar transport system permease protein